MKLAHGIAVWLLLGMSPALALVEPNEVGIYADPDMQASHIDLPAPNVFDAYLAVFDPRLPNGAPLPFVETFECHIETSNPGLVFLAGTATPVLSINVAGEPNSYIIGFVEPLPVTPGQPLVLMTLTYAVFNSDPEYIYLSPPAEYTSLPGQMSCGYWDSVLLEWVIVPMYPNVGAFDAPTFAINGTVVAVARNTWGGVKSLFH